MTADMQPEPCGDHDPVPGTMPPLQPWDLHGQLTDVERAHIEDIPIADQEYL